MDEALQVLTKEYRHYHNPEIVVAVVVREGGVQLVKLGLAGAQEDPGPVRTSYLTGFAADKLFSTSNPDESVRALWNRLLASKKTPLKEDM